MAEWRVVERSVLVYTFRRSESNVGRGAGEAASERGGERKPAEDARDDMARYLLNREGTRVVWLRHRVGQTPQLCARAMSHLSFPSEHGAGDSSSAPPNQFYSSFDANAFQMNPLSSHPPPRTPRTSVSSSSHVYGASIYDTKEEPQEPPIDEEDELEEGTEQLKQAELRVRKEDVWREMFLTSNGRDKAFVR